MTREDIIRMAREADLVYWKPNSAFSDGVWWMDAGELGDELESFAALVAAAAKAEEHEACAKVRETEWSNVAERMYGEECATAIRARSGDKK